jgi:hypothetical protein
MRKASVALLGLIFLSPLASAQSVFVGPSLYPPQLTLRDSYDIVFNTVASGSTNTQSCYTICFFDQNGRCDLSGQVTADQLPGPPFSVTNLRVGPYTSCQGTPATVPVTLSPGEHLVFDLVFSPQAPGRYADTFFTNLSWAGPANLQRYAYHLFGTATSSFNCAPDDQTACLSDGRFKVTATFDAGSSGSGNAHLITLASDTAYLWFFAATNVEAVLKVLDGCSLNNHYWVFAGGLTNVEVAITVTDTSNGTKKVYSNKANTTFVPVQDTSAFPACP